MSLATRLLGREILTLQEFTDQLVERLAWEDPDAVVTRPRPDCLTIARGGHPVEFTVQSSYRDYQKDPRALQQIIARFTQWVTTTGAGPHGA